MSVEQAILEAVRALPPDKQEEILMHASVSAMKRAPRNRSEASEDCGPILEFLSPLKI